MKKVFFTILFLSFVINCQSRSFQPFIAIDLVGYNTGAPKQAFLVNATADSFEIVDVAAKSVVYSGAIAEPQPPDATTGDQISVIDFTNFTRSGEYYLRTAGSSGIRSHAFTIGPNVYKDVALASIQSFYYARCGTAVNNGEPWKHPACHLDDAYFWGNSNRFKDVAGGWHDAGDYNKFTVNTAFSVGLLLYLYEARPDIFSDNQLDIPESDNGTPDLLDEIRWALEWMMKMQSRNGGVYHKVSQKKWIGEFLPHKDPAKRYIFRITTNATASFTATAALAARLFQPFDRAFANKLKEAALDGWLYLLRNPKIKPSGGFKNPPGVVGGEYSDDHDEDVRLWAAIELYKLTENEQYLRYFAQKLDEYGIQNLPALSWKNFEVLTLSAFLNADLPSSYAQLERQVLNLFKGQAVWLLNLRSQNNYQFLLGKDQFYWGSNSVNLAYAFVLIQAYEHTGRDEYYKAALDQLHYTLGRNPFNLSYVTGVGYTSVQNPYHQFSQKLDYEKPVPGMLVGGPNNKIDLRGRDLSNYPAKSYEDRFKNYVVNETAINYTAIFAYVAGYFASPKTKLTVQK